MDSTNIIGTLIAIYITVGVIYLVVETFRGTKLNPLYAIFGWPVELYHWTQKK